MVYIQHLELVIFIASRENKITVVCPNQFVVGDIVWLDVHHAVVPPSVLHHYGAYLSSGVGYVDIAIADTESHLLIRFVDIYICIGSYIHRHPHQWLHDHEACCGKKGK